MKILVLNSLYAPLGVGGAERSVRLLAEELVRRGHDVAVVSTVPSRLGDVCDRGDVRCHTVPLANVYWPFTSSRPPVLRPLFYALDAYNPIMGRRLGKILEAERPDVLHTNNLFGFSAAAWVEAHKRGVPIIHTMRDYYLMCRRATMFRRGENCAGMCTECAVQTCIRRSLSHRVDAAVGVSRFILDRHLSAGYFRDTPVRRAIFNISGSLGLSPTERLTGPLRLGYLGRLEPEKGIELLLAAVIARPPATLLIGGAGDPGYVDDLHVRFASERIRFLGFTDPYGLLKQVDFLVVPSLWHEPMGRSVVESYAAGVPVIAAARGGITELVDEGSTGFLFDPARPTQLFDLISELSANPARAEAFRSACLAKSETFGPARIAEQYEEAYTAAIAAHTQQLLGTPFRRVFLPERAKIRVAILGTEGIPARYGGFETFAEQLAIRWAKDPRFEITVVCPGNPGSRPEHLEGVKLRYVPLPNTGPAKNVLLDARALWSCRRDYDIVYMLGFGASWALFLPRLHGNVVWVNMAGLEWKRTKWGRATRTYVRLVSWLSTFTATRLIADADAIRDYYLRTYGNRVRCTFIPYGANPVAHDPESANRLPDGLTPGEYFLVVARLEPENQVLEMIDGYLKADVPQSLVVVGNLNGTRYVQRLQQAANGRVRFLGGIYDQRALMALRLHARAHLHGHTVGGTNPSLLEALAAARPIIAHDNPFNREVAGDVAWYFRGPDDLARLLRDTPLEPPDSLRPERSRERVRTRYSWDRVTRDYIELALSDARELGRRAKSAE